MAGFWTTPGITETWLSDRNSQLIMAFFGEKIGIIIHNISKLLDCHETLGFLALREAQKSLISVPSNVSTLACWSFPPAIVRWLFQPAVFDDTGGYSISDRC